MPYDDKPRFSPWDDRSLPNMFDTEEEARRVAAFAWIERRYAEVLRELAGSMPQPVSSAFERLAKHHDWHATVLTEELTPAGAPAAELGKLPAGLEHVHDLFDAVAKAGDVIEALAGLSRVVSARVITAYAFHEAATGTELGAERGRWLDIIASDSHDERNELELYLQSLIAPGDVDRIGQWQAKLETPLVRAGGLLGHGTLGGDKTHVPSTVTPLRG